MNTRGLAQAITLAGGFAQGRKDAADYETMQRAREEDRAMRKQEFDARMEGVNRDKTLRISLADAATPASVTEDTSHVIPPDQMGPSLTQYKVKGAGLDKTFDDKESAYKAVQDYSAPDAVAGRQANAYRASGAPEKAISLENSAFTQKRERTTFDQQQAALRQQQADTAVKKSIEALKTPEHIADFMSSSPADKMGGEFKAKARYSADGKTFTFDKVNPDGSASPTGQNFENTPLGMEKAKMTLAGYMSPEQRLKHYEWEAETTRKKENDAADTTHKAGMLGAAQTQAQAALIRAQRGGNGEGGGTKAPSGYRFAPDGKTLEAIPGGPADKVSTPGKPLPISAANGLLTNQENLRRAQKALALVNGETVEGAPGDTNATGKKGWLPNQVLNRIDPAGVDTRAAIADLGSLVIHDRSGAAVTASEFPRLAPFIPTEKDDAQTVKKKLMMFTKNYQAVVDDAAEFYRESGYKVPIEKLKSGLGNGQPKPSPTNANPPRVASPAEAMKLPPGTVFVDANGVTRRRP